MRDRRAARARLPVPRRGDRVRQPATSTSSWSSRTATGSCARCSSPRACSPPEKLTPVLHYDGTPITARFIHERDRAAPRRLQRDADQAHRRRAENEHDLPRQAEAAPPRPAEEHARLHAPRLRGHGLDAVRRLRARLDQRARSSRRAASSTIAAAPRGQALGHRLLVEDADLLPRQVARLQLACTAACPRCSPAPTSPTAT